MGEEGEKTTAEGCFGCLILLVVGTISVIFVLYLFTNGNVGAIKDVKIQELNYSFVKDFLPPKAKNNQSFYSALKKNSKVTKLKIKTLSMKAFMGERAGMGRIASSILGSLSSEMREMDSYFEIVRVSFVFEKRMVVTIDFLVLEGMFWGTIKSWFSDDMSWAVIRPWAQYYEIVDFKTNHLNNK